MLLKSFNDFQEGGKQKTFLTIWSHRQKFWLSMGHIISTTTLFFESSPPALSGWNELEGRNNEIYKKGREIVSEEFLIDFI